MALVMNVTSYWYSDKIVLSMYHARELAPSDAPLLHSMVGELSFLDGSRVTRHKGGGVIVEERVDVVGGLDEEIRCGAAPLKHLGVELPVHRYRLPAGRRIFSAPGTADTSTGSGQTYSPSA